MDPRNFDTVRDEIGARNQQSLLRLGLMVAIAFLFATSAPPPLTLAVFSSMALVSAMVISVFALLFREQPWSPHFTRWDEAAAMLGLSLLTSLFVDPAALQAALDASADGAVPASAGG